MIKTVSNDDAVWAADEFISYFENLNGIEDYLRYVKKEVLDGMSSVSSFSEDIFNFDIHPEDMEFSMIPVGKGGLDQKYYKNLLASVSSHNNESNIPGREHKWIVKETTTNTVVGFIRLGSPTINSKPRNLWLGKAPNLSLFNRHACMGFVIVPTQPFGYNFLGGKLLALMCCSHFAREFISEKFEKDIALFETTSLYGSTTSASQYDGLKPFIRYRGLTESKFTPLLHDAQFHRLHDRFTYLNGGDPLTDNKASSKKMKRQTKMISIIKNSLDDAEKLSQFNSVIAKAFSLTEKKRFYTSDYGYENVREVLSGEQSELRRGQNWDKHELDNIIKWWKKKAGKRYEKLKSEGRFRKEIELWTETDDIQIIR